MFLILILAALGLPSLQNPSPATTAQAHDAAEVVFNGDAGVVLNYIRSDKAADFEAVMTKLKEALQKSGVAERRQQAAGWKVVKCSEDVGEGQVLYLWIIDPVVKDADYSVPKILSETFPGDARRLYDQFAAAYARGKVKIDGRLFLAMGQ